MPKTSDSKIAVVALIALAAWLLIGLPLVYLPYEIHIPAEVFGVKPGEWLLFLATMGLWYATWRLVRGADRTAERQLRAYVFIKDGGISITPDGVGFVFGVVYKNFGQTPAYQYSTWTGGGIYAIDDLPFPKEPKALVERINRSIVGPFAETQVIAGSVALSPSDLQAIRNRTKAIFIWGGVDYVDAFNKPRHFRFKMRMTGPESQVQPGAMGWALNPHPLGYDAN